MSKIFRIFLLGLGTICNILYADIVYIVGIDSSNGPAYWTVSPPGTPSNNHDLNIDTYTGGTAHGVALSSNGTAYIVGQTIYGDLAGAAYWTVSHTGVASSLHVLDSSDSSLAIAYNIAFNPSGTAYIVGKSAAGNAAYWTISPSGTVSGPTSLTTSGAAFGVTFSLSGQGYITGIDGSSNGCYWTISNTGTISSPIALNGASAGGTGSAYGVAVAPDGTAYIVGSTTGGVACYWTIPSSGTASSATSIGNSNSTGYSVAFLSSGAGMIVGQNGGNVSVYWPISSTGSVGLAQTLPNGTGSASSAYGVAFSSSQQPYITGADQFLHAVYWTSPLSDNPKVLAGGIAVAYGIAIYLDSVPNAPTGLSGKYVVNDFALLYENCAVLNWLPSDSIGVVGYKIYKNGIQIGTVDASTTQYKNHNQNRSSASIYTVRAVDSSGHESSPATVILH